MYRSMYSSMYSNPAENYLAMCFPSEDYSAGESDDLCRSYLLTDLSSSKYIWHRIDAISRYCVIVLLVGRPWSLQPVASLTLSLHAKCLASLNKALG